MTTQRIAELEAEVLRLREVLKRIKYETDIHGNNLNRGIKDEAVKALSTPFTPQHLPALVEKVEKIWREKCASRLDSEWDGDADTYEYSEACNECAERIRTLPVGQIKLSELFK